MAHTDEKADVLKVVGWIEERLAENIALEDAARLVAVSKYHFHRVFHAHIGMPFAEYVRQRRLANAAGELVVTDRRILDIAFDYAFESQAAFARAFKRTYRMSPGQYRRFFGTFMDKGRNQSEEDTDMKQTEQASGPNGWVLAGSDPGDYDIGTDVTTAHRGRASGRLQSRSEQAQGFATMMQSFRAELYRGRRYELSAFIRNEEVASWCGLWMRVDGKNEDMLQFDNMADRPISGSGGWSKYSVVLDVPEESESISFGVLLAGAGKVWIDSVRFEEVSLNVPSTNMEEPVVLPDRPINLDFEDIAGPPEL
ncbi:AraC family transcriptional regulator [Cohnella sp. CIP 111063]|uniref:helix-turn-helix transcriptional regulator n=1 Tax=unclassified Cohnella TaxID=2636738 RepID=UPI000B8BF4D9|nr:MULTISPECIES: AraC family transcriptional regulator [unclassified Cohnella]OXS61601.1 AraC family transcriptional regulator [Cohnella sp. CIP 111063]PRX74013.1 AraC-like DNA-binding protein [Cohnella sp. SGD-V74]